MTDQVAWEHAVAEALLSADPAASLAEAARDPALSVELRTALASARPDGVRVAALLVARLRFERLIQGSRRAADWFGRDPATFTAAFKRYHLEIDPTAVMPSEEAAQFDAWLERR